MSIILPTIESNLPRQTATGSLLLQTLKESFGFRDPLQRVGATTPFLRVQPAIYLDVAPVADHPLLGTIPANRHHPFGQTAGFYATLNHVTGAGQWADRPRIVVVQPGDDQRRWAREAFAENNADVAPDERHKLAAIATAQGLSGSCTVIRSLIYVPVQPAILSGMLEDAAGDPQDLLVAFRTAFAENIMQFYNKLPRGKRNTEKSKFVPAPQKIGRGRWRQPKQD